MLRKVLMVGSTAATAPAAGQGDQTGNGSGSGSGTGSGSARTPGCTLAHLRVSIHNGDAGSGHWGLVLVFKHDDSGTCVLRRYPGVAGLDASGNQVTQARRTLRGYLGGLQ